MADSDIQSEWSELPLDTRILEALKDLGWTKPTAVQSACVPLALKGKDISIQSRTGSGKTGAFVIPAVQRLITEREQRGAQHAPSNPSVLILVPSVELCEQTTEAASEIAKYVQPRFVVDNLASGGGVTASRVQAAHIVVSTAALLAKVCNQGAITAAVLQHVRFFVLDEADVVASVAERSLRTVQSLLPPSMQVILASATLTKGVAAMKGQLLRHPVNVVLTSEDVRDEVRSKKAGAAAPAEAQRGPVVESRIIVKDPLKTTLHQYYLVATDECHSHTLLFGLYRMALIQGKTLIFVNDDEQTYRLQNFLEQLGVATLAYDANLPINVRLDTLKRFQSGAVSTLVCTDGTLESAAQLQMSLEEESQSSVAAVAETSKKSSSRRRSRHNDEAPSALHRGIDFAHVRNVILFDGVEATDPIALSRYTHRIGRAGRAGEEGVSIAIFSVPQARKYLQPLRAYCTERGESIGPFRQMLRATVAKLQYRVDSVLGNITRTSTRKMRVASVASELSRSSYLANHLSQKDTDALKRVMRRSSKKVKVERNILDVPYYMKLSTIDDAGEYRKRVHANQTQSNLLRKAAKKATVDPLKAVVSKLRSSKRRS
ncbi:putative ATP-dependent RNA helicase [Leptomonas pyrrhocoris]|uniref:Putative ATP-dependent RNA helicase n=1 Tax=Leptomonas pyrrhocoris TaxID=157538 RepID=A0A0N0VEQ7_LEPPY|nr:putative ATP-dependent RNA helicase [Leptomonas pyrrhocoris]KPA79021.1 putative ATP-dependent RNA helicase [Leptomonas pyrrhocoris]|eukprot:XP_015657460.1 putative ATP-dependent RNA helicase [Leptomonas pyrrhocoris]